jgi:hypothetical protein
LIALAAAAGCLAGAPSALARHSPSVDFRVVDIGSVVAFDVDVCTPRLARMRFEADFRQGERAFVYRRWRSETHEGCARLFLGIRDSRQLFGPGQIDARLRISVDGVRRSSVTRWRRFYVE